MDAWPQTAEELVERQSDLAAQADDAAVWVPPPGPLRVAAVFSAFPTGVRGPGAAGDRVWTAAVVWQGATADADAPSGVEAVRRRDAAPIRVAAAGRLLAESTQAGAAGAPYVAGLLGLRAGAVMERALREACADVRPDVLLVDATGRDHPRGAGLALHLGAVLDLPSVGVTNRLLVASFEPPDDHGGAVSELRLQDRIVGFALRSRAGAKPIFVHAGWRTDARTALAVVRPLVGRWRTPEPLRLARHAARVARAREEGRYPE